MTQTTDITWTELDVSGQAQEPYNPAQRQKRPLPSFALPVAGNELWMMLSKPFLPTDAQIITAPAHGAAVFIELFPYLVRPETTAALAWAFQMGHRAAQLVGPCKRMHMVLGHDLQTVPNVVEKRFWLGMAFQIH